MVTGSSLGHRSARQGGKQSHLPPVPWSGCRSVPRPGYRDSHGPGESPENVYILGKRRPGMAGKAMGKVYVSWNGMSFLSSLRIARGSPQCSQSGEANSNVGSAGKGEN